MADLSDIQAAQTVKVVGSDSSGVELTPVQSTATGALHSNLRDAAGNAISSQLDIDGEYHLATATIQDTSVIASNSSTSNLAVGASFTGGAVATNGYASFSTMIMADQQCTISIQESTNGTNWDVIKNYTALANVGNGRILNAFGSYLRVVVTNTGSATTTVFRLQTNLIPIAAPNPPNMTTNKIVTGTITTACSDANIDACPPTAAVVINSEGAGTVIAQHLGTWTGVVVFDVSYDNGITWEIQSCIDISTNALSDNLRYFTKWSQTRLNDRWAINPAGSQLVRLRAVTLTSGTIPVTLTASAATVYTNTAVRRNPTYSASATSFATASSATDIAVLTGSATKTIKVFNVGYASVQNSQSIQDIFLIKRSTANSGGTSAAMTAVSYDSQDSAATATAVRYTANPSSLGTSVGIIRPSKLIIPPISIGNSVVGTIEKTWSFSAVDGDMKKPLYLRGTGESLCINQNGTTLSSNSTICYFEWTEE